MYFNKHLKSNFYSRSSCLIKKSWRNWQRPDFLWTCWKSPIYYTFVINLPNIFSLPHRGCFLTSSLIGTIAMSLQIPLSILFDVFLKRKPYSPLFYIGSLPIFFALILVALLMRNDDTDPLMRLFKVIYRKCCSCKKPNIVR